MEPRRIAQRLSNQRPSGGHHGSPNNDEPIGPEHGPPKRDEVNEALDRAKAKPRWAGKDFVRQMILAGTRGIASGVAREVAETFLDDTMNH